MRRFLLAAAAAVALSLPALAQDSVLRIGMAQDADMLDPTLARSYVGRIVFAGLCEGPISPLVPVHGLMRGTAQIGARSMRQFVARVVVGH